MADIKVLMVLDGGRFNFGPQQAGTGASAYEDSYFGIHQLVTALQNSTTPSIQVDRVHRRGHAFNSQVLNAGNVLDDHENCSVNLTVPGDFVFALTTPPAANTVTVDLADYDVLWMIGDEGHNGTTPGTSLDAAISGPEKAAIAKFMHEGGGVFAVGDHDAIGSLMCGELPRVRTMRRWFEWDQIASLQAGNSQVFLPNWSDLGLVANSNQTDRMDTLHPDSLDGLFYFNDQSDPTAQTLMTAPTTANPMGTPLATSPGPIHTILRSSGGTVISQFPDHMHEGEATDFNSISPPGSAFNPNVGASPYQLSFTNADGTTSTYDEFPAPDGYQPTPEVICYGVDSGHGTYDGSYSGPTPDAPVTGAKSHGIVSLYDGRAVGVGRVITGATFHHYLDKNLVGDPGTAETFATPGHGPTGSDAGLPPDVLGPILDYYVNAVTWLAPASLNFHFLTLKNTYGFDEVADAHAHGNNFANAFYLVLDGYTPNQVGAMPPINLSGPFKDAGASFLQLTAQPTDAGSPNTPQRILIPFNVQSIPTGPTPPSAFPPVGQPAKVLALNAELSLGGTFLSAESLFELVAGADPYFSNLGAAAADEWYLSQDLRVFQAGPGAPSTPFVGWPGSGSGYDYIKSLLTHLNTEANGFTDGPTGGDPFTQINEANDLSEASSVTPHTQNFAIARVRLKGESGTPASGVRVFFRLWTSASNDTDFDAQTTYRSTYTGVEQPSTPLPGVVGLNAPIFASDRSGSGDFVQGVNLLDLTVGSTGERWAYFGCFLDVYGNPNVSLNGTHHCLVAQIVYDGAPIEGATGVTLSPENCDKLAQRNIQITPSGNPGGPLAHRVPQAFDLRPSQRTTAPIGELLGYPDELMIDWGEVPHGSKVSIYWPQAPAIDVVRMGMMLYATDQLQVADEHTVRCVVTSRFTYVPIPFGVGGGVGNFAGLFTIDLPQGVKKGQRFTVVVRRLSTRQDIQVGFRANVVEARAPTRRTVAVKAAAAKVKAASVAAEPGKRQINRDWRYVVGAFQVSIPVDTEAPLLRPEENALAILKWRLQHTPPNDRWYPVLVRYVGYVSDRVKGFGGDPGAIPPSPTGIPEPKDGGQGGRGGHGLHGGHGPHGGRGGHGDCGDDAEEFTGKVCEVVFDCFGGFDGFVLDTCASIRVFASCEPAIGELVLRALRERLLISVFVDRDERIRRLIVRG